MADQVEVNVDASTSSSVSHNSSFSVILVQPSSAASERVFSLLANSF